MTLRIEPGDVGQPAGEHRKLLTGDQLTDFERFAGFQSDVQNGAVRSGDQNGTSRTTDSSLLSRSQLTP